MILLNLVFCWDFKQAVGTKPDPTIADSAVFLGFIFRRNSGRNSGFRVTYGHFDWNLDFRFDRNFGLSFSSSDMKHDPTRS